MRNGNFLNDGLLKLLTATVLIGVASGTIFCCCNGTSDEIITIGTDFVKSRMNVNFGRLMINSFLSSTVFLVLTFLFGFCAVGQPAELGILLFRGMGIGITVTRLYLTFGTGRLLYSMLMVVPAAALSTAALIAGGRAAVRLSGIYLKLTLSDRQENGLLDTIKLYGAKFLVLESVLAVSTGIECICVILLKGKF